MSRIRISQSGDTDALAGFGTTVELDGREVKGVRSVDMRFSVDELVTAKLDLIAHDNFEIDTNAEVIVTITPVPGASIEYVRLPDGRTRYVSVWMEDPPVVPRLRPRGVFGMSSFTEDIDSTHFKSPGCQRQHEPGRLRAYAYVRVPMWMMDLYLKFREWKHSWNKSEVAA